MKKLYLVAAFVLAAINVPAAMAAGSTNADVNVTVNLTAGCKMTTPTAIALTYTAFSTALASTATEGTFTVSCSQGLTYNVGFTSGATPDATKAVTAATANNNLAYTLSLDSASGTGAGATAQNHRVIATVTGNQAGAACTGTCSGTAESHTVYVVY